MYLMFLVFLMFVLCTKLNCIASSFKKIMWWFLHIAVGSLFLYNNHCDLFSICAILKAVLSCQIKKTCYWCILKCEFDVLKQRYLYRMHFLKDNPATYFLKICCLLERFPACMVTIKCLWDLLLLLCKSYILLFYRLL